MIIIGVYAGVVTEAWAFNIDDNTGNRIFIIIYSVLFFLIGLAYAFSGRRFYTNLYKISKENAKKIKWRVFISIFFISLSFIIRGVFVFLYYLFNEDDSLRFKALRWDSIWIIALVGVYYIFSSAIPTIYLWLGTRINVKEIRSKSLKESDAGGVHPSPESQRYTIAKLNNSEISESSLADSFLSTRNE